MTIYYKWGNKRDRHPDGYTQMMRVSFCFEAVLEGHKIILQRQGSFSLFRQFKFVSFFGTDLKSFTLNYLNIPLHIST